MSDVTERALTQKIYTLTTVVTSFHSWIRRKWMLMANFLEQLVYSVMPEIRSTLAYIMSINSYKTVPLLSLVFLGKPKKPQQLSSAVQCHSCEDTAVRSWCRQVSQDLLFPYSQPSSTFPGACCLTASERATPVSTKKLLFNYILKEWKIRFWKSCSLQHKGRTAGWSEMALGSHAAEQPAQRICLIATTFFKIHRALTGFRDLGSFPASTSLCDW